MVKTEEKYEEKLKIEKRFISMEKDIKDLARRMTTLEKSVITGMEKIDKKLEEGFVPVNEYEKDKEIIKIQMQEIRDESQSGKNKWDWIIKTVMGAIIVALLSLVVIK